MAGKALAGIDDIYFSRRNLDKTQKYFERAALVKNILNTIKK